MTYRVANYWVYAEELIAQIKPKTLILGVTTNGCLNKRGEAVMGAGIALDFKNRFRFLPKWLGESIRETGIGVRLFPSTLPILVFPTKYSWQDSESNLDLIVESAHATVALLQQKPDHHLILPLPGCGCGRLSPTRVLAALAPIFDPHSEIHIVHRKG